MANTTSSDIIRQYRPLKRGEFFVVGVDTASGGIDSCVAQFMSKNNSDVPLVYSEQVTATEMTPKIKAILEKVHDVTGVRPCVAFERNNGGVFEMERLARMNKSDKYSIFEMFNYGTNISQDLDTYKVGWETNSATRPKMLSDLKEAIDHQLIGLYDKRTIEELFSFIIVQGKSRWKATADIGKHDDHVMSLAVTYQLFQTQEPSGDVSLVDLPREDYFDSRGFY
jgi:hypothetical protein